MQSTHREIDQILPNACGERDATPSSAAREASHASESCGSVPHAVGGGNGGSKEEKRNGETGSILLSFKGFSSLAAVSAAVLTPPY
jgi:hypothetical protein